MDGSSSSFTRQLGEVLTGVRRANEIAEALVTEAVHKTLEKACCDYPLDFATLAKKYTADVVRECCELAAHEGTQACGGKTQAGKPCRRQVVLGGFCKLHLAAWQEQQSANHRRDAYAASVKRAKAVDPYASELASKSKRPMVAMTFDVAKHG